MDQWIEQRTIELTDSLFYMVACPLLRIGACGWIGAVIEKVTGAFGQEQ